MEKHEYGMLHTSHDNKVFIYPNCKESLLKAVNDGYQLEFDTEEYDGRHRIWIPYDKLKHNLNGHFTLYRIVPKKGKLMEKYICPQNVIELVEAREKGYTIELNGSAINGGYGETWNVYSGDDFGWSLSAYRIVNPDYKIEVSPIIKNNNTFEIEITFKFRIPENNLEVHKDVAEFLKTKINNYDYYNELVRFQVLKNPNDSIINKLDRLEHLERAISLFRESLLPVDEQDIETTNALHNHNKQAREILYKDL